MPTQQVLDPVILPIIRRVWPQLLAQQIIGVQPMTGPIGQIFTAKANFQGGRVVLSKVHFGHFLRVYNRRKYYHPEYLTTLGYQKFRINIEDAIKAERWCRSNLKPGSYIRSMSDFWFAHDRDAMMFGLTWK
jgi:hypothetical protein